MKGRPHHLLPAIIATVAVVALSGCSFGGTSKSDSAQHATTSGPLVVGFEYTSNAEDSAAQQGGNGVGSATGDLAAQARAVVKAINAAGGVGGRPIKLELVPSKQPSDEATRAAAEQTACQSLTVDHHVDVAISTEEAATATLLDCLKGIITIGDLRLTDAHRAAYPNLYSVEVPSLSRSNRALVASLVRRKLIGPGTKVGVVANRTPADFVQAAKDDLIPALEQAGADVVGLHPYEGKNLSSALSQMQSAALKFKSTGATVVIDSDAAGLGVSVLAAMSSQQNYRPLIGLTSDVYPSADLAATSYKVFSGGAAGIGWMYSGQDVLSAQQPPAHAAFRRCMKIMRDAGLRTSDPNAISFQTGVCDAFFFLQAAGSAAKGSSEPSAFKRGAQTLKHYDSAVGAVDDFSKRTDGPATYRDLVLSPGCQCFEYAGEAHPF